MDFQEDQPQPQAVVYMWRKVYAEGRRQPSREEYEAAIDAAIATTKGK
jgi:hypothetical protein